MGYRSTGFIRILYVDKIKKSIKVFMFVCWDNFAEVILQVPYFEGVMLQVRVVLISARTKGRKRV